MTTHHRISSLRRAVLAALASSLLLAASAHGELSITVAHRAITTYETRYWKGQGAAITVERCRRRSRAQVTCIARAEDEHGSVIETTDWATVIAHGIIRVHPGKFEIVQVLE